MDFLFSFSITIFTFILFLYYFSTPKYSKNSQVQHKVAPKVVGAWPIIGHLHLLLGPEPPHIRFGTLADKYGPIFSILLGVNQAIVVSDSRLAKECLTTNDKVLATRPKSIAAEVMGYNYAAFSLAPMGPYWRLVRRIFLHEIVSNRRVELYADFRVSEVKLRLKDVYEFWAKEKNDVNMVKIEMKEWFGNLITNIITRMLVGKRYLLVDKGGVRKKTKAVADLIGTFMLSDAVPYVRWLDLGGQEKIMRSKSQEMDDILEGWLKEFKEKRKLGLVDDEEQGFMDAMLTHVEAIGGEYSDDLSRFDGDTIMKAVALTFIGGATDTTTVTLTWALSLLLNNPQSLKIAQDELDIHVGRERQVEESDLEKLVYLQAIVKETFRLYPPLPLGLPHHASDDCVIGGYHVPKGTSVYINYSKIHRDSNVWSDPYRFQPERFLTKHKDVEVRGTHFELIPFASGRRMCPGMSFGLQTVQFVLASLIHGFEFGIATGDSIDMTESIGLGNLKATPLEVLVCPRLSYSICV